MEREINISNGDDLPGFFEGRKDIETVYLFGSHGTEHEEESSDIDLGVLFAEEPAILELMNLEAELEKIIEREVDVVSLNKCNILLKCEPLHLNQK